MIRHPAYRVLIFLVLLAGLGSCKANGCGAKPDEMPTTSAARVEQMTSKLPGGTATAFVVSDLGKMRATLNVIKDRLPNTGIVETMQKQVQHAFGIDLLDAESWKRAGVIPDSSAVVAVYRSRLLFLMYVDNRQAFEKTLVEKAKAAFSIEAVTKTQKIGEHQIKVLSDDPQAQIAWLYQGKLALVAMPAIDNQGSLDDGSAVLVLSDVADGKKDTSLWADKGFQAFRTSLVEKHAIAAYINPRAGLGSDAAKKKAAEDPNVKLVADWAVKNVPFVGAGISADGDQAVVKAYLGLAPDVLKNVMIAQKAEVTHNWDAFSTEKMLLGARISMNVAKTYALILEAMPEEQRRGARRNVKSFGDGMAIDLEKEVLDQLAGHVGLFFYGVAGGNPMALMGIKSPQDASNALGLMILLKFKNAAAVDALIQKVVEGTGGAVTVRPFVHLPDDPSFKVVSQTGPMAFGNFFIHGDTVAFATTAFGDEAMHKYLIDARDDKKLSVIEGLDLGKAFATGETFSGLYFNSARAQENLGAILAMGGIGPILASIQEASLSLDADDHGAFGLLTIDLVPAPPKPATDPAAAQPK